MRELTINLVLRMAHTGSSGKSFCLLLFRSLSRTVICLLISRVLFFIFSFSLSLSHFVFHSRFPLSFSFSLLRSFSVAAAKSHLLSNLKIARRCLFLSLLLLSNFVHLFPATASHFPPLSNASPDFFLSSSFFASHFSSIHSFIQSLLSDFIR